MGRVEAEGGQDGGVDVGDALGTLDFLAAGRVGGADDLAAAKAAAGEGPGEAVRPMIAAGGCLWAGIHSRTEPRFVTASCSVRLLIRQRSETIDTFRVRVRFLTTPQILLSCRLLAMKSHAKTVLLIVVAALFRSDGLSRLCLFEKVLPT